MEYYSSSIESRISLNVESGFSIALEVISEIKSELNSLLSSINLLTQYLMKYLGESKAKSSFSSKNRSTLSCQSLLKEWVLYSGIIEDVNHRYLKNITIYRNTSKPLKHLTRYNNI